MSPEDNSNGLTHPEPAEKQGNPEGIISTMKHPIHLEQRIGRCLLTQPYTGSKIAGMATLVLHINHDNSVLTADRHSVEVCVRVEFHQPDTTVQYRFILYPRPDNHPAFDLVSKIAQRIVGDRSSGTNAYAGGSVVEPHCITDAKFVADIVDLLAYDHWKRFVVDDTPTGSEYMITPGDESSCIRIAAHDVFIPFPFLIPVKGQEEKTVENDTP